MQEIQSVAGLFNLPGEVVTLELYGAGLINDTYMVVTQSSSGLCKIILQRINDHVFSEPEHIMHNLRRVVDHMGKKLRESPLIAKSGFVVPQLYSAKTQQDYVIDAQGHYWRAMGYIDNSRTFDVVENISQAEQTGYALGSFQRLLSDIDSGQLYDTLPGFHITPRYLAIYDKLGTLPELPEYATEIHFCRQFVELYRPIAGVLENARGDLIERVIHGDPKLNNVLFHKDSGMALSLIDLDTVKPGLVQYDIGDCLRSCCNTAGESPADFEAVKFNVDIARAILKGYFDQAAAFLQDKDYQYIYDAILLLPYELGLRFFTDFLQGNQYFKVSSPDQNLRRAMVQFRLAQSVAEQSRDIQRIVTESRLC